MRTVLHFIAIISLFISALTTGALSYAQPLNWDSLRTERAKKITSFLAIYPSIRMKIDSLTGTPQQLAGEELFLNQSKTDPVEAIYEFLELNKGIFGINQGKKDFKLVFSHKDPLGDQVQLKQVYKGIEVWNGRMKVNFDRSGKLSSIVVLGRICPDINISPLPTVDSSKATAIAIQDLKEIPVEESPYYYGKSFYPGKNEKDTPSLINCGLFVGLFNEEYRLVWIVRVERPHVLGFRWEYWIDAQSGTILQKVHTR